MADAPKTSNLLSRLRAWNGNSFGPYRSPVPHIVPHKPRVKRYLPIPRPETIDRIGRLYVQHKRISYADREATWLDVAKAYADGWKDAECIIPSHRLGHSASEVRK